MLSKEWRIFKEIKHFHDMNYIAKPLHKNPYPMDHEIYNFGRPAFGHHYYVQYIVPVCLIHTWEPRRGILKK